MKSAPVDLANTLEENTLRQLEEMAASAGIHPSAFRQRLARDLHDVADARRAVNNLQRFLGVSFTTSMLNDFQSHPILQQVALQLFSQSQFLSDILVRDPELFRWLTATGELTRSKSVTEARSEARAAMAPFERIEKRLDALKRFHRRELLRIGAKEILGEVNVAQSAFELSCHADAIVQCVLELGLQRLREISFENELAIIGLGKLGGEELNFSSDIDLMFVYEREFDLEVPAGRMRTAHQLYNKLAEFVVRALTERTGEGYFYRVDMRLRPEGAAGSLALSRQAYRQYYETRGELWERQMLIKARVIAGNTEVGQRWLEDIMPFVYPKTTFGNPTSEIRRMKEKIEAKVGAVENIKLGGGGIRDIEFIAQALQLVFGGTNPAVRAGGTLKALEELHSVRALDEHEVRVLSESYLFLRSVEHRLQLLHGLQTHSLPEDDAERTLLARRLGFKTKEAFQASLDHHRREVKRLFESILGEAAPTTESLRAGKAPLRGFHPLDTTKFEKHLRVLDERISSLREDDIRESFLHSLKKYRAPEFCVENLVLLAESGSKRTLEEAFRSRDFVDLLVLISSRSRNLTNLLAREPLLLEALVGQTERVLHPGLDWKFFKENDLWRYKSYNELKIVVRFLIGKSTLQEFFQELTALAEEVLMVAFHRACELHSFPPNELCVVGFGKFGGGEITVGSDLDIVVLYNRRKNSDRSSKAERIIKEVLRLCQQLEGVVYDIDLRLRPEGASAPVAVDINYYKEYLKDRASLWERQSLTKARIIIGHRDLAEEFEKIRNEFVFERPLAKGWVQGILRMRRRMETERSKSTKGKIDLKIQKGGMVDVEFLVQAFQMKYGNNRKLAGQRNLFDAMRELRALKYLPATKARILWKSYEFLRQLETAVRLNGVGSSSTISETDALTDVLAGWMKFKSGKLMTKELKRIMMQNRTIFLSLMRQLA